MALPYALYQSQAASGSRDSLRAYLGTIPNYTAEVEGVPLTGVRAGSPADKAGLRADDVVISLGGPAIANISDYTYALVAVKSGEETTLGIIRQGQTMQMTITPQARP
ncbi:MAG: PDZ domain-containing protein [Verrucomicrobiota bacterium]